MTLIRREYLYGYFKQKYEETKPIRGRAVDVRPLGQRRRDWEQVVKSSEPDGDWYGVRLYDTNVVMYHEDGRVRLESGGWVTQSTAYFMCAHSPFVVNKTKGNLWVEVPGVGKVPIIGQDVVTISRVNDKWVMDKQITLTQVVMDRSKTKPIRDKLRGFEKYASTMLKLSDGWVTADTLAKWRSVGASHGGWRTYVYEFGFDVNTSHILRGHRLSKYHRNPGSALHEKQIADCTAVVDMLSVEDVDVWDRAMYCILTSGDSNSVRVVATETYKPFPKDDPNFTATLNLYDHQYSQHAIKNFITKLIKQFDVYTTREVDTSCIRGNLVI